MKSTRVILTLGLLIATGCSGGGGGDATPTPTPTPGPTITSHPFDQTIADGGTATFTVVAANATSYQWQRSVDSGATFADVSGATTASYTTPVMFLADGGALYRVVVGGAGGAPVTSNAATLTVTPVYSGTIAVLEEAVLNPGTSGTFFGQGVRVGIAFTGSDTVLRPSMEETPGSPLGCKAWSRTPAEAAATTTGLGEGIVQVTLSGTGAPTLPACTFTDGFGYLCPETTTESTGGEIGVGPQAGTATLTDTDVTYSASNCTNRYVNIRGAGIASNNGTFPILAVGGATVIVYANPGFVAETLPGTASHVNLAGIGATPMAPDPGFLPNDATFTVSLTTSGGGHFPSFTASSATATVGDDFALDVADANLLNAIPKDGTAFTIACGSGSCLAGSATLTVLDLVTTDAPTGGLSPFAMPQPITESVRVRCASVGTSVSVPAAYSALIQGSGSTRIRASFLRTSPATGGDARVTIEAGHGVVGFTN